MTTTICRMKFDVECVKKCLKENSVVYTVRGYDMVNKVVFVEDIGKCYRQKLFEVESKFDLKLFLNLSGFISIGDWWDAIQGFTKGRRKWMYRVSLL